MKGHEPVPRNVVFVRHRLDGLAGVGGVDDVLLCVGDRRDADD